jgi:hypothetical protein
LSTEAPVLEKVNLPTPIVWYANAILMTLRVAKSKYFG